MNLKDAAANLNQAHPEDTLHPLYTPWGELLMRSGSYDDILSGISPSTNETNGLPYAERSLGICFCARRWE